jgi:hypothetical protein
MDTDHSPFFSAPEALVAHLTALSVAEPRNTDWTHGALHLSSIPLGRSAPAGAVVAANTERHSARNAAVQEAVVHRDNSGWGNGGPILLGAQGGRWHAGVPWPIVAHLLRARASNGGATTSCGSRYVCGASVPCAGAGEVGRSAK